MVADVVNEASLILVYLDLLLRNWHQGVTINVILQYPVVIFHHPSLGQLPLVSGGHSHDLVLVVLELAGISYEGVGDDYALVLLIVRQAVLHHLQLLLLLPVHLLGLEGAPLATHTPLTSPGNNSAKLLSL